MKSRQVYHCTRASQLGPEPSYVEAEAQSSRSSDLTLVAAAVSVAR